MPLGMFAPQYGNVYGTGATFISAGITGTVTNFSAPTGAVAFLIESESTNTVNLRWSLGLAANSTIGFLMEPGRDSGLIPAGITLSICGSTSTVSSVQSVDIMWITGG